MTKGYVFLYGSLQPGHWNAERFPGLFLDEQFPGSVRGRLYWAQSPGTYPVAVLSHLESDEPVEGLVHGTWVVVDMDSWQWRAVWEMEHGAGYVLRVVQDASTGLIGLSFHYHYSVSEKIEITSGNWAEALDEILNRG